MLFKQYFVIISTLLEISLAAVIVPHLCVDQFLCWLNTTASDTFKKDFLEICFRKDLDSIHLDTPSERVLEELKVRTTKENFCNIAAYVQQYPRYYPNCERLYNLPKCPGSSNGWTETKEQQLEMFYNTADFGYIKELRRELKPYCRPRSNFNSSSSLECTDFLRYCIGHNLVIDFNNVKTLKEPLQYRDDILRPGDIEGVGCDFERDALLSQGDHNSHLMSWFAEVSTFEVVNETKCDLVIEKPVMLMKLDATINMYHHFCDFLNLYLSQHLNRSNFELDVQIITWDSYGDLSNFASIWKVFTSNSLTTVADLSGSRVCFRGPVMFNLLPRMIYGLYYNMPLVPGCEASSMVQAFNRHLLARLGLPVSEDIIETFPSLRIVFISRSTRYRRVLNERQLIEGLRKAVRSHKDVVGVEAVNFNHQIPFESQIRLSSTADLLIGMHGAGLTHTLFQPDWASLFELYNCEDRDCYHDLARLRGIHYVTWSDRSKLQIVADDFEPKNNQSDLHAKFVNYRFDVSEFVRISLQALEVVRGRRRAFIERTHNCWWWEMYNMHSQTYPQPQDSKHTEL